MDPIQIVAALLGLMICAGLAVYVIHSIRNGTAIALGRHYDRAENPVGFWVQVGVIGAIGIYGFGKLALAIGEATAGS